MGVHFGERHTSNGLSAPQMASAYHDMGALVGRLPKTDGLRAAKFYQLSLQLDPGRPRTRENYGVALAVAGRWEEAAAHLELAHHLGQDTPELWNGLGACHFTSGRLKEAEASFVAALRLQPGSGDAAENLQAAKREIASQAQTRRRKPKRRRKS